MRKHHILIITLISLLLTGCFGSRTSYVYDGSPTALEIVIKRNNSTALRALQKDSEPESEQYVRIRIWKKNEHGDVVYSAVRSVPLSAVSTEQGYTMSEVLPSDKGYYVSAVYADTKGLIEAAESNIDVPAETLTTTTLALTPIEYEVIAPGVLFSGGSLNQFKATIPDEYSHIFRVRLYYSNLPWQTNSVDGYGRNVVELPTTKSVGTVYSPTPIYYQFVISLREDYWLPPYPPVPSSDTTTYIPNLDAGEELPHVMRYPDPSWIE